MNKLILKFTDNFIYNKKKDKLIIEPISKNIIVNFKIVNIEKFIEELNEIIKKNRLNTLLIKNKIKIIIKKVKIIIFCYLQLKIQNKYLIFIKLEDKILSQITFID